MRNLLSLFMALLLLVVTTGCGGGGAATTKTSGESEGDDNVEVNTPLTEYNNLAGEYEKDGAVVVVGVGEGLKESIAYTSAQTRAAGQLAVKYEQRVETVRKDMQEQLSSNVQGGTPELNEYFSNVVKVKSKQTLQGAKVFKTKTLFSKKKGMYTVYMVYGIDPKAVATSIVSEAKAQPQLYARFRATQAFKELEQDMESMDQPK
ncbi:MAG: hypothetical protein SFU91_08695 [Chloroherpetonaceae bacterium]|nr:hypothetical protein [Chloroherpetonaceae bacterium]